ncbi:MAG: hypothetical protein ACTTJZ_00435, partial [Sphaerochaetaceae bacterium]
SRISPYAPDIDIPVKQFSLTAGASSVMSEVDTLLAEHGWCLDALPDGTFTWKETARDSLAGIPSIGPDDILADGFRVDKRYEVHDGVCVLWPKTKVYEDTIVYRGNLPIGDSSDPTPGEAMAAGDYWPEDSDMNEVWMDFDDSFLDLPYLSGSTRRKNSDIDLISSSGWRILDIKDPGISIDPITPETPVIYEPLRARLRYRNTSDSPKRLYWTEIWAKALVRDQLVRSSYPESAGSPDEYKARHIYDDAAAERLARIRWMRLHAGCWKVSFRSTRRLEPGDFLHLDQAGRFGGDILITSRTRIYDFSGIYSYTAVTTEPISNVSIRRTASGPSGRQRPGEDGRSSYLHIAYADSADGSQGFSTTDTEGKLYIGQCTDFSPDAPLDHSLYMWSRLKGEDGEPGAAGKGISSITEHYLATDAAEGITLASAGWTTALQTMTPQRRRLWRYTRIAYTDGTSTDTAPCIIGVYGDPGADAVTVDIGGGVMQIPVDADGKAIASTSFNVIYKGWQGYVEQPCTASTGTLPQGMTATIGTDRITLTVAEGEALGGGIIGTVDISITCCGLPFSRKATWAKALDAARVMQDMQAQAEAIEAANGQITSLTSEIAAKASQTEVSALAGRMSDAETSITQNSEAIALRATKTEMASLSGTVQAQATQITQHAAAIQSKASQSELDTVKGTVNSHGTQITQQADSISSLVTRVTSTENTNASQQTAINQNASDISTKAAKAEVNTLAGRVTSAESSITQNANAITLKASSSEVDAIRSTAEQHAAQLDVQAGQIRQKITAIRSDGSVMADAELAVEADGGSTQIRLDADKVLINGSVKADKIDLDDLAAQDILLKENGALHSARYDRAGQIADPAIEKGTYIGADGQLKAFLAELESVMIKGRSIFQGEITSAVLSTSLEDKGGKTVTAAPFPAASDCSYKNSALREFIRTRLTPNTYASGSFGTYDGKTVVGLIRSDSSNPTIFQSGAVAYNSGSYPKTLTFSTPAWPTHVQLSAVGLGYDYETTSGYWSSSSFSGSGNAVPSSGSPPSNPSDGDTYIKISDVEETGGSPRYTWRSTTHTYHETTTSHSGTYAVEIKLNGASVQSGSWIYAPPSSTISLTFENDGDSNEDGSYTLKYDNFKRYGANVCVLYQGWAHEAIPASGMSNKSVSLTVSGAAVRGGSGQSSWSNLTPYSQFRGLVQDGAAVSGAFSIHANNGISFTDESGTEITITGQGTAFAHGAMLSFSDVAVSGGGDGWSAAGKWFSAWSVSFVPVETAKGVHVSDLLRKTANSCIGTQAEPFKTIYGTVNHQGTTNKVWGAVFNP